MSVDWLVGKSAPGPADSAQVKSLVTVTSIGNPANVDAVKFVVGGYVIV